MDIKKKFHKKLKKMYLSSPNFILVSKQNFGDMGQSLKNKD